MDGHEVLDVNELYRLQDSGLSFCCYSKRIGAYSVLFLGSVMYFHFNFQYSRSDLEFFFTFSSLFMPQTLSHLQFLKPPSITFIQKTSEFQFNKL